MTDNEGILNSSELSAFLGLGKLGIFGKMISAQIMKLSKLDKLNSYYLAHKHLPVTEFIDAIFDELGVQFTLYEKDLNRIPTKNAFITVSNHPLGGIDGLILVRTILSRRSDFKIIGNFLLDRVKPLEPYLFKVNPFENRKDVKSSITGLISAMKHLKEGHSLGIFPAGEVSMKQKDGTIKDKDWEDAIIKLIMRSKVTVVPIYFAAQNSNLFYSLSDLSPDLRTALLPSQMTSQKKRKIIVRIGNPIPYTSIEAYDTIDKLKQFLTDKTYILGRGVERKNTPLSFQQKPIRKVVDSNILRNELKHCREAGHFLFSSNEYDIYLTDKVTSPHIITEIGIQREIVFREIGEGTNNPIDLDIYDDYYKHLVIFHRKSSALVGAYRMGLGRDIFPKYGIKGFYLSELFNFEKPFEEVFLNGIELGRAFITKQYQRSALSLFTLWKGIMHILMKEDVKYLIGGVSISNNFSEFSKSVMVHHLQIHYFDHELEKYVTPKLPYKPNLDDAEKSLIKELTENDLLKIDKFIDEIEPQVDMKFPVLLKKYIKQNAKLVAFNIDPKFNNCIDGLMVSRLDELPDSVFQTALKEYNDQIRNS